MEIEGYGELDSLRRRFTALKQTKLALRREAQNLGNEITQEKAKQLNELKILQNNMLANKDLRAEYGISSDKVWTPKVKELTQDDENTINETFKKKEEDLQRINENIEDMQIVIADMEWELKIKLGYELSKEIDQQSLNILKELQTEGKYKIVKDEVI